MFKSYLVVSLEFSYELYELVLISYDLYFVFKTLMVNLWWKKNHVIDALVIMLQRAQYEHNNNNYFNDDDDDVID